MNNKNEKTEGKRVLVIDDEEVICNYLKRMLEQEGYSVTRSWGGNDGLAKLSAEFFDLVMTDMMMPDRNGIQVIILVRDKKWPTKIIAMSDTEKSEYQLRIAEFYKVDATIKKPLIRDKVLSVVNKVMNRFTEGNQVIHYGRKKTNFTIKKYLLMLVLLLVIEGCQFH